MNIFTSPKTACREETKAGGTVDANKVALARGFKDPGSHEIALKLIPQSGSMCYIYIYRYSIYI